MKKQKKFPVISLGIKNPILNSICTNENPHCLYYVDQERHAYHASIKVYKLVETLPGVYDRTICDVLESLNNHEKMLGIAFYLNARNTFMMTHESCVYSRLAPYYQGKAEDDDYAANGKYPKNAFLDWDATGKRIKVTTFGMEGECDFDNLVSVKFEFVGGEEVAK